VCEEKSERERVRGAKSDNGVERKIVIRTGQGGLRCT